MFVLVTALIINNIQRRYPVYWISPSGSKLEITPAKRIDRVEEINKEDTATGLAHN